MIDDDQDVVRAVRRGDREAFGHLVHRYQQRLFGLSLMMMRERTAAEDVTQEAFVRAFTHLDRYDTQRAFYPWLATIAVRLAQNALRHRGRTDRREGASMEAAAGLDDRLARLHRETPIDLAAAVMARIGLVEAPPPVVAQVPDAAPFPARPSRWGWPAWAPLLGLATSLVVFAQAPTDGATLGLGLGIPVGGLAPSAGVILVGFALYVLALRAPLTRKDWHGE